MKGKQEIYQERDVKLRQLGYGSYQEYLDSEEWRIIKEKVRIRPGRKWKFCNICESDKNLNIHHSSYKVIGQKHPGNTIKMLCNSCHNELHNISKQKPEWSFYRICGRLKRKRIKDGLSFFRHVV